MEANQKETTLVSGNVLAENERPAQDGWISPEVLAAQAGETVEMGKELPSNEELDEINNA